MNARYAIYYAPPSGSILWEAACRWLGRDPTRDAKLDQPEVPGYSAQRLEALTRSPRLYGFHATLKPPFHLADGHSLESFRKALRGFSAQCTAFALPPLQVEVLSGFLALCPVERSPALHQLADDCVTAFDEFRRPPEVDELARRRATPLSARQDALLDRYGYPYVLDEFRFHMTLTERLEASDSQRLRPWLGEYFHAALCLPVAADAICLFAQERPAGAFRLADRFPFGRG